MLLLSVRACDELAYNCRLAVRLFTGKHSPDEPNTMKRPRRPDAVGPVTTLGTLLLPSLLLLPPIGLAASHDRRFPMLFSMRSES